MLTEKIVHDAANKIDAKGIKPSHRLVYDLLQTGSYTTITKYLRTWKPAEDIETPVAPDTVGRSAQAFAADMWQAAYATAEVVANKKVEVLNTEILALQNDLAGVTAAADSYAGENAELRKGAADKDARLDRALAQVVEQKIALAAARAEIETWRRASTGRQRARQEQPKRRRKAHKSASGPSDGAPPVAA